jgi:hypothetical protein
MDARSVVMNKDAKLINHIAEVFDRLFGRD